MINLKKNIKKMNRGGARNKKKTWKIQKLNGKVVEYFRVKQVANTNLKKLERFYFEKLEIKKNEK